MHALEPQRLLELDGAVLHELSYQQLRNFDVPRRGVYVASEGHLLGSAGIEAPAVLTHFDGVPLNGLDDLLAGLGKAGKTAQVRYFTPGRQHMPKQALLRLEHLWFPARLCERRDGELVWPCQTFELPANRMETQANVRKPIANRKTSTSPASFLVSVDFDLPFGMESVEKGSRHGVGVVVDAERGWVVTDRHTVPVALGDIRIGFNGQRELPARVLFLHPTHNLALLGYEPEHLGGLKVRAVKWSAHPPREGEELTLYQLSNDQRPRTQSVTVTAVRPLRFERPRKARFQESNLDAVELSPAPKSGGVLIDSAGAARALWVPFDYPCGDEMLQTVLGGTIPSAEDDVQQGYWGIPAPLIKDITAAFGTGTAPRSLQAHLDYLPLSRARQLGLPEEWGTRLEMGERTRVVAVEESWGNSALRSGDLLLAIDDADVVDLLDAERRVQREQIRLTVLRDRKVVTLTIIPAILPWLEPTQVLHWAGAVLHDPHPAVLRQFVDARVSMWPHAVQVRRRSVTVCRPTC